LVGGCISGRGVGGGREGFRRGKKKTMGPINLGEKGDSIKEDLWDQEQGKTRAVGEKGGGKKTLFGSKQTVGSKGAGKKKRGEKSGIWGVVGWGGGCQEGGSPC